MSPMPMLPSSLNRILRWMEQTVHTIAVFGRKIGTAIRTKANALHVPKANSTSNKKGYRWRAWGEALKHFGKSLLVLYLRLEQEFIKLCTSVGKFVALKFPKFSGVQKQMQGICRPLAPYKRIIGRSLFWGSILILLIILVATCSRSCHTGTKSNAIDPHTNTTSIDYTYDFTLGYAQAFPDENQAHLDAAQRLGITPISDSASRAEALSRMVELVTNNYYKVDSLEHSIPYLVPEARDFVNDLGTDFAETLKSKHLPPHKFIVTSVTRTLEQTANLNKKNRNSKEESAHCYGTTIDISWKRFDPIAPQAKKLKEGSNIMLPEGISSETKRENSFDEQLKTALASVLHQYRISGRCLVKYERKQACFHITIDRRRPSLSDFAKDLSRFILPTSDTTQQGLLEK